MSKLSRDIEKFFKAVPKAFDHEYIAREIIKGINDLPKDLESSKVIQDIVAFGDQASKNFKGSHQEKASAQFDEKISIDAHDGHLAKPDSDSHHDSSHQ